MAANLSDAEWALMGRISLAYAVSSGNSTSEEATPTATTALSPAAFNTLVRGRIPPRGARFTHDHHDTCAYIARSKNANVVAYTANFIVPAAAAAAEAADAARHKQHHAHHTHHHNCAPQKGHYLPAGFAFAVSGANASCAWNPLNPIHGYFVNLEPSYLEARRKKGTVGDCDDLKLVERKLAYGLNTKVLDCGEHIGKQLPSRLKPDSALYKLLAVPSGGSNSGAAVLAELRDWWKILQPLAGTFVALPSWPAFMLRLPPLASPTPAPDASDATTTDTTTTTEGGTAPWCTDADTVPAIIAVIANQLSVLEKVYVKSVERWMRLPYVEYIEVFGVSLADGTATYEKLNNDGSHQPPENLTKAELAEATES